MSRFYFRHLEPGTSGKARSHKQRRTGSLRQTTSVLVMLVGAHQSLSNIGPTRSTVPKCLLLLLIHVQHTTRDRAWRIILGPQDGRTGSHGNHVGVERDQRCIAVVCVGDDCTKHRCSSGDTDRYPCVALHPQRSSLCARPGHA